MGEKGLKRLRQPTYRLLGGIVRGLVRAGVHPNVVSTFGFLVTLLAGLFYHQVNVRLAGAFVLLGGIIDILDGQVARTSGLASRFGSFYDSTLDRVSEIVVFLGLASMYATRRADPWELAMIYVIFLAMGGSMMVSYTRARAEGLGLDCKRGLMQRAERIVLLGVGSVVFGLAWDGLVLDLILITMAALTNLTALYRIVWVYQHAAGVSLDDSDSNDIHRGT